MEYLKGVGTLQVFREKRVSDEWLVEMLQNIVSIQWGAKYFSDEDLHFNKCFQILSCISPLTVRGKWFREIQSFEHDTFSPILFLYFQ